MKRDTMKREPMSPSISGIVNAARKVAAAAAAAGISNRALCAKAGIQPRAWRNTLKGGWGQWCSLEQIETAQRAVEARLFESDRAAGSAEGER